MWPWEKRAAREDAMRRLGGEDLAAERAKYAMNGDNKTIVIFLLCLTVFGGFAVWRYSEYKIQCALHPTTDITATVQCLDQCSRRCVEGE